MVKILFSIMFFALFLQADVLNLTPDMDGIQEFSYASYIKDSTKKLTIEMVRDQPFKNDAHISSNSGLSRAAWWLKLHVENKTQKPIAWVWHFPYGQFDNLQSWQYDANGTLVSHAIKGDKPPVILQQPFNYYSSFQYRTPPKHQQTVYIKIGYEKAGLVEMFSSLWTHNEFIRFKALENGMLIAVLSALGTLLFYNIFLWIMLRKKEYFWYNLYLVGVIFVTLTYNDIGVYYIWGKIPLLVDMMPFISIVLLFFAFLHFTRAFLETYKRLTYADKLISILDYILIAVLVLAFFSERYYAIRLLQLSSIAFIFFPYFGFVLWKKGYKIARGYTIASAVVSVSVILSLLRFSSVIETSQILFWLMRFCFIAEGILLAIALADRIATLEYNYKNSQEKIKLTLEEAKTNLQKEVQKRTLELEVQTKRAQELARTDLLTGIGNRRALLERGEELVGESKRYGSLFSLIALDLDFFKSINDSYGHEGGDAVLRLFAKHVRVCLRETDFFARSGGEEFVILLPHTDEHKALQKAQILLNEVQALEIPYKNEVLKITVSMGVSEFFVMQDSLDTVLAKADKALYYVKAHGRNNVKTYNQIREKGENKI
jgi:two-component system, sensor histidine kinase LadS